MAHHVLMIVTSNAHMGSGGKPTGIWAEELAAPYYALTDAGVKVSLASPSGGVVPIDAGSLKPSGKNAVCADRMLADEALQGALSHTRTAASQRGADFGAIFFPGGHGTMWDLPVDAGVTQAVEGAFRAGKFITSVCHGAAGLVTARRADGQSIVKGLRVNSFTDAEEAAVGLTDVVPFLLESRLRALGGLFENAANWQPFVVTDGLLITGQNPQSSELVAHALLKALGVSHPA
jgi:putative intracellular protease/amidase